VPQRIQGKKPGADLPDIRFAKRGGKGKKQKMKTQRMGRKGRGKDTFIIPMRWKGDCDGREAASLGKRGGGIGGLGCPLKEGVIKGE